MFCVVVVVNVMWDICYDLKLYICSFKEKKLYICCMPPLLGIKQCLVKGLRNGE